MLPRLLVLHAAQILQPIKFKDVSSNFPMEHNASKPRPTLWNILHQFNAHHSRKHTSIPELNSNLFRYFVHTYVMFQRIFYEGAGLLRTKREMRPHFWENPVVCVHSSCTLCYLVAFSFKSWNKCRLAKLLAPPRRLHSKSSWFIGVILDAACY